VKADIQEQASAPGVIVLEPESGTVVAIIQARMGSSRFPGKSLADIAGHPMLWQVVNRVRAARLVDKVVVATSDKGTDDPIAAFCERERIPCFRGDEQDVLDRYYWAASAHKAGVVVRITADCPLIDSSVIDYVISEFKQGGCEYVSNTLRYTLPDGLDAEVFSFEALTQAWSEARKPSEREHVTPYLKTTKFRSRNVEAACDGLPGTQRWTVDHPADLEFVRAIYAEFLEANFGYQDVFDVLQRKPELMALQANRVINEGYYRSLYAQAHAGAAPRRNLAQSQAWLARSQAVIPGCAQTFSKGHTQYVQGAAPIFLQRGKGCRVWDVDSNEYIDYVQGLLPNILGYANEEVNRAAVEQLAEGHSFSLPHPLEVQLAERLTRLIPCAEMVRFGKNGSDATSGAVRAARAFTGRDHIACCGYHGWQDWYIGSTTRNGGVPIAVRDLTHAFRYNDLGSLQQLLGKHPGEFAAVIMEPVNFVEPAPGFLQSVKDLAQRNGALLIFDEICSGFHFGLGGAQKRFGVIPDLACFGKAMGNGFPISCVMGRKEVMRCFEEVFFSFTFAGEVASMAAAMKVLDILETTDALTKMDANGRTLQDGFNVLAQEAGLADRLKATAHPTWSLIKYLDADGDDSPLLKSLFQQEAVKRGVLLLATHNLTQAHQNADIVQTLEVYVEVMKTLASWLSDANPQRFLEGPMVQPIFRVR
jgi:glutamate-1-semialdehyde 2,1-aminomutase/spore coat polysaccharide biosynthesis protein SpsF